MKALAALLVLAMVASAAIRDETANIGDSTNQDMVFPSSLNSVQLAFNKSSADENVVIFKYDPRMTYKVRLRTSAETTFVLPPGEKVVDYALGDTLVFQFRPVKTKQYNTDNFFTITPKAAGADTNLRILGSSGRVYNFYLRADNHQSPFLPHFTVYVSPDGQIPEMGTLKSDEERLTVGPPALSHFVSGSVNMSQADFNYVALSGGDKKLKPDSVFDDGRMTFFLFKQKPGEPRNLPVVYRVADGYDTPVNSRVEGEYIVAETVSDRWTLRAGEAHLCIAKEGR